MNESVEISAKTIDEALKLALRELNVIDEMISVKVIDEPSKGLLGLIGSKNAKIQVNIKEDYYLSKTKSFIEYLLNCMQIEADVTCKETEDMILVNINGGDVSLLIGKRGETLESIQYLLTLILNRYRNCGKKIIVDVENYRDKRIKTLENLAFRLAKKVTTSGKSLILEPMSAYERRIIHSALQDDPKVTTYSSGTEPNRKVVIKLK